MIETRNICKKYFRKCPNHVVYVLPIKSIHRWRINKLLSQFSCNSSVPKILGKEKHPHAQKKEKVNLGRLFFPFQKADITQWGLLLESVCAYFIEQF